MHLIRLLQKRRIEKLINNREVEISEVDQNNIQEYQLRKFNEVWKDIYLNVPYYSQLVKKEVLQKEIKNWDDLKKFPIQTRDFVQSNSENLFSAKNETKGWTSTGGSTGRPFKFPFWKSEKLFTEPDLWSSRKNYGIKRSDKLFILWGHSHQLGTGMAKYIKTFERKIKDNILGYRRYQAYNLSTTNLNKACDELLIYKPSYMIGYSNALYQLAKANEKRSLELRKLNLKAIIATSEAFSSEEHQRVVEEIFGCKVIFEYGSAETTIMASTVNNGYYKVFWNNYILEGVLQDDGTYNVLVTSLYPRAFPLIRYEIGDKVSEPTLNKNSITEFRSIHNGRGELLFLDEETPIHTTYFEHCIKPNSKVIAYQVINRKDNIEINILAHSELNGAEKETILKDLSRKDERLGKCKINCVHSLKQTVAGKTKIIINEEE
jgi:phenylacetate-CoA ligase